MSSYFTGTVNPNIKGGSSVGDTNPGGGVGIVNKHPASGLGSDWNMGPIYPPKGEWDDFDEEYYQDDEDDIEEFDMKLYRKSSKSFNVTPTDSKRHKGNPTGYMGGIGADMSAVIGMSAGKSIDGQILIEDYIREILKEYSSSSGNIAVQSKPKASNFGSKNLEPYVVPGLPVDSDGAGYIYTDKHDLETQSDEIDFNSGMSSWEVVEDDLDKESKDLTNFLNKNKLYSS